GRTFEPLSGGELAQPVCCPLGSGALEAPVFTGVCPGLGVDCLGLWAGAAGAPVAVGVTCVDAASGGVVNPACLYFVGRCLCAGDVSQGAGGPPHVARR